ncbi:NAD(P)/FAD-dependent oxidoreductase [Companilactobacillus halodurans]|uniref:Ferredoxin--NADP reductase n=1 Tax=Companilactobacillus halodurans TaxID=2584183 RepID=A0A5P0ZRL2_9LACO|nr:NAD(P)/FAD-dependent oxidoreductase [Companilactobacillus halodurans]MQS76521.1 NAD(P)/FAD-dependent oxidoreductase [Companilactobacillus halodurans]MQS96902.1 NAD(P)/FAD-dependent oxidoreductase [Companilactobacillus halodurans]
MNDKIYDISIIGGGPAGMFAAYFARLRNLKVALIESLPKLGGQPETLYAQKHIYDIAALPKVSGTDLTKQLTEQLEIRNCDQYLSTSITSIVRKDDLWELSTNKGETITTKAVIIAIGNGAFEPRKLTFDYDSSLDDEKINYFVNNIDDFKDVDVAVAGGGDSAVDWAIDISKIAKSTSLIHRRNKYRAMESSVDKLNKSDIQQLNPYIIKGVNYNPDNKDKIDITLKKIKTNDLDVVTVDKLLVNYGFVSDSKILRDWNVELNGPFIKVTQEMETNLPNVFAIGDIVTYPGKLQLIATAFAEGPIAVTKALRNLYPDKDYFEHSTSIFEK